MDKKHSIHGLALPRIIQGVPPPKKKETKAGEDITSRFGQLHPSMFRLLKAHLVDIKCVYHERNN